MTDRQGEIAMHNHYQGDPYWTTAKFPSTCHGCKETIERHARIFYYPKGKHVFCARCGQGEYERFRSIAEDEYAYNNGM